MEKNSNEEKKFYPVEELQGMETKSSPTTFLAVRNPMQRCVENNIVYRDILQLIEKLDFVSIRKKELIDNSSYKEGDKISISLDIKNYYIITYMQLAGKIQGYEFALMYGLLYVFNREYWQPVDEKEIIEFLAFVANKSGILYSDTQLVKSKRLLLNQFISNCNAPNPKYNTDRTVINLRNGTLEFDTEGNFEIREFRKEDMLRYQLSYDFNPDEDCPLFKEFLNKVLPEKEAQDLLMEMIGYCFIPTKLLKLETAMMLYGKGQNGKGVVYQVVQMLLGEEHITGFSMQALSSNANARAQLANALLNYTSELGGKCDPDTMKKLISGEDVEVKTLYKDVEMLKEYTCKFMFNTNTLPKETEANIAFFRRWKILPFLIHITDAEKDVKLAERLKAEISGIFNLVVSGIVRLLVNERFTESELANKTLEEYKITSNSALMFVKECGWKTVISPRYDGKKYGNLGADYQHVTGTFLYQEYLKYCEDSGRYHLNRSHFYENISEVLYVQHGSGGNQCWIFAKQDLSSDDSQSAHKKKDEDYTLDIIKEIEKQNEEAKSKFI